MRIIAVDDERLALEALVSSIVKAVPDAAVHGFRDPAEAMDFLRSHICDVAFLDIRMRGISGLELARRIKELHGSTNIVFVTGYSEYALDAFRVYASDYLLKPPTPGAVAQALQQLRTPIVPEPKHRIRFQCFGNFDVFADGKALTFHRGKAKELLAYLVDRKGAGVTMGELSAGSGTDKKTMERHRKYLVAILLAFTNGYEIIRGHLCQVGPKRGGDEA